MRDLSRREILKTAALAAGAAATAAAPSTSVAAEPEARTGAYPISLNTSTLRGHKLPIRKTIEIAEKAGYTGIEPWPNEIDDFIKSGGKLADLKKELSDKGLTVTGAIAFFRWMVDDKAQRAKALEEARVFMDKLAQIGGTHMAAPPTGKVGDVKLLDAADRYRDLLVASENFPVIPAVEVWGFQNNLYRLGQSVLVALEAQHPRACVLPDVYHLYKGGSGLSGVKHLNGSLIGGFHLNDYPDIPRKEIKDRDRVHPGLGVAPLDQFFKDLWSTGYRGALSIELFNPEYWKQDPLKVAKTSLDRTKAIMKKALG
jgi:sugar phosphate isomerase/epimerase